jgi:hypothetical protein
MVCPLCTAPHQVTDTAQHTHTEHRGADKHRQTDRQTDRHTDRQTHRHTDTPVLCCAARSCLLPACCPVCCFSVQVCQPGLCPMSRSHAPDAEYTRYAREMHEQLEQSRARQQQMEEELAAATVRARPGRLSVLSALHRKLGLCCMGAQGA